jgi:hypothetical protein
METKTQAVLRVLAGASILSVLALPMALLAVASTVAEAVHTLWLAFIAPGADT